ncbi:hypothetical protein AB0J35_40735 [Nonomuraea angiospora]|uniref:hypothetical protein n=1 Tax=Nonomuraea angiospora TaxID=46172 RepID=UPI003445BEEE
MTALCVQLSVLPAALDHLAAAEELLDELDRRAAADIQRLTARRADIAALRRRAALSFLGLRRAAMTQTMNTVLSEATPHLDRATVRTGPHSGHHDQPQSISL